MYTVIHIGIDVHKDLRQTHEKRIDRKRKAIRHLVWVKEIMNVLYRAEPLVYYTQYIRRITHGK